MLHIVYGQSRHRAIAAEIGQQLEGMHLTGTLYIGYPVLASADETATVDALLVSSERGLVAFLITDDPPPTELADWKAIEDQQNRLYFALESNLARHQSLRLRRRLAFDIHVVTVFPVAPGPPSGIEGTYASIEGIPQTTSSFEPLPDEYSRPLQAALQRVTTIKPQKRRANVKLVDSRGSILKQIEGNIANLDQWQKRAAIESPDGPQRIRGLAGSGKTIVLALKAAYLHAQHPDWSIVVTFHTRSLYQQFEDLVRRFCFEHIADEPDWTKLRIMHSWGGSDREGVYTEIAHHCNHPARDFLFAKTRFGREDAFKGICDELLADSSVIDHQPLYDAVLIDEAQDLPPAFFQLVYRFTRHPKRIVLAYDELQRLSETSMPPLADLFGLDENGNPMVSLVNTHGSPRQDVILPVCYRNTPWALTLAHALGFGIHREQGLVQHFDEPALWTEIGYRVKDGQLAPGQRVRLERDPGSYPDYFIHLLTTPDAVQHHVFSDDQSQLRWLAESIRKNLIEDELEHDDILIIVPDAYTAKPRANSISNVLAPFGIPAHLAGVTTSRDELFHKSSVAIANIFRSKGNEAPMVYVLDCQCCHSGRELVTLRSVLFTAVTRSRAWVRLCGWGSGMRHLGEEIDRTVRSGFNLDFPIPTPEQLQRMRQMHRERTAAERTRVDRAERGLRDFVVALEKGDVSWDGLSAELKTALARHISAPALTEHEDPDRN